MNRAPGATTDSFTEAEVLLAALVERREVAWDDWGQHCFYCTWWSDDYAAEPAHDESCPIRNGRAYLGE